MDGGAGTGSLELGHEGALESGVRVFVCVPEHVERIRSVGWWPTAVIVEAVGMETSPCLAWRQLSPAMSMHGAT